MEIADTFDVEDITSLFARELIGAMARANGDGQGVYAGALDEIRGLIGIGQQIVVAGSLPTAPEPSSSPASRVSREPTQANSPSTETSTVLAISTTVRVTATFYS